MTKTATTNDFRHLPKTYSALVAMLPPRPIHDDVDLANATEVIDRLAGFTLTPTRKTTWRRFRPLLKPMNPSDSPLMIRRSLRWTP